MIPATRRKVYRKHGFRPQGPLSPTYLSWKAMRQRVRRSPHYLGVRIDPRWDDFALFLADMGERPEGKTLDRIDNDKGYEPTNCRWATPLEQTRNRRCTRLITKDGRTQTMKEWSAELGISYETLASRAWRGAPVL